MNQANSYQLLLDDIKRTLICENYTNYHIISLYDISKLMNSTTYNFNQMLNNNINRILSDKCNAIKTIIHSFNYQKNELIIRLIYNKEYKLSCIKINNKLLVKELNAKDEINVSFTNNKELSDIYDEFMKYKKYVTQRADDIIASHSNFLININNEEISMSSILEDLPFNITCNNSDNKYIVNSDLDNITEIIKDTEENIFKHTYIYIQDCPDWMQSKLYETRKQQIFNHKTKIKKKH